MIFAFFLLSALGHAQEVATRSPTPMSWMDAVRLFRDLEQLPIPFTYSRSGCEARDIVMGESLRLRGVASQRLIAFAATGNVFHTQDRWGKPVRWSFHVMPIVRVRLENAEVHDVVLDPSISDRPLFLDQVFAKLGVTACEVSQLQWAGLRTHPVCRIYVAPRAAVRLGPIENRSFEQAVLRGNAFSSNIDAEILELANSELEFKMNEARRLALITNACRISPMLYVCQRAQN